MLKLENYEGDDFDSWVLLKKIAAEPAELDNEMENAEVFYFDDAVDAMEMEDEDFRRYVAAGWH